MGVSRNRGVPLDVTQARTYIQPPRRRYRHWTQGEVPLRAARKPGIAGRGKETLMELKDYIRIIRKRWRIIMAAMLVVLAGAALATALSPKVYEAHTQLFVSTSGGNDSSALLQGSNFTQQRVKSYADVITTPKVLTR